MEDNEVQKMNEYYRKSSESYDTSWFNDISTQFVQKLLKNGFNNNLKLDQNSIIIDYGGGSGILSQFVYQKLNLKNEVLCIDPSIDMIKLANKKKGVLGQVFDPDTISSTNNKIPQQYKKVDLILMSCCLHYIKPKDRKRVFDMLASYLKPNGIITIMGRPDYIKHYPFPSFVFDVPFGQHLIMEIYDQILNECELKGSMVIDQFKVDLKKEIWYDFLIKKQWSNLRNFDDDQIKKGIEELEKKFANQENFKFFDYLYLIILKN